MERIEINAAHNLPGAEITAKGDGGRQALRNYEGRYELNSPIVAGANKMLLKIEKIPVNSQAVENEIAVKVGDLVEPEVAAAVATVGGEPVDWMPDGAYTADGERVANLAAPIDLQACLEDLAAYDMQRAEVAKIEHGYRVARWRHPDGRREEFTLASDTLAGSVGAALRDLILSEQERTGSIAAGGWDADETMMILAAAEHGAADAEDRAGRQIRARTREQTRNMRG